MPIHKPGKTVRWWISTLPGYPGLPTNLHNSLWCLIKLKTTDFVMFFFYLMKSFTTLFTKLHWAWCIYLSLYDGRTDSKVMAQNMNSCIYTGFVYICLAHRCKTKCDISLARFTYFLYFKFYQQSRWLWVFYRSWCYTNLWLNLPSFLEVTWLKMITAYFPRLIPSSLNTKTRQSILLHHQKIK